MHRILFFFREHRRGVDARRRRRDTPAARPADSIQSAPGKTERGGEEESRGGVGFDRRAREVAGDEVQRRGSPELREKGLSCLHSTGLWSGSTRETRGGFCLGQFDRRPNIELCRRETYGRRQRRRWPGLPSA